MPPASAITFRPFSQGDAMRKFIRAARVPAVLAVIGLATLTVARLDGGIGWPGPNPASAVVLAAANDIGWPTA